MTKFGVDFEALDKNQKLKQSFHHQRIMESHIAAYAKEVIRSLTMQYVPCPTVDVSGHQMLRERTPEEVKGAVDRGIWIAELTYQRMHEMGWLAEVPPLSELREDDANSGGVRVMTREEELAHLTAPAADPKQQQVDYWGHRAEKAEDMVERWRGEANAQQAVIHLIWTETRQGTTPMTEDVKAAVRRALAVKIVP